MMQHIVIVLKSRAFEIARNYKYYGYQRVVASMICKFFDKKQDPE